ncbi:MAG: SAVED domain-containing protein [Burkholderiales bacterium]
MHLFFFGPFGLAVLLGQKLNGLADIQCYERSKAPGYTPSCRLPA